MTPAARHQAALEVLADWLEGRAVEAALGGWARGARYAGARDRAAVRDIVYDVLRQRGVCADLGGGDDARSLILGLVRLQGADAATLFSGQGYGPDALDPAERRLVQQSVQIDRRRDTPGWLLARVEAALGAETGGFLEAMAKRAPLFLRVNTAKADRPMAQEALARDGIATLPEPDVATALRVTENARALQRSAAYHDGWVEPQDLSVQWALAAMAWPSGGRVLDFCAGGGGKALAIAAATGQPVWVHDANPRRMADLPARAARAGADLRPLALQSVAKAAPFDAVLVDVPCSGAGTWRRDPEAKWRLTAPDFAKLIQTQSQILTQAAALVRPGGQLVYMTCSVLTEENEDRIAGFLASAPDWRAVQCLRLGPESASDGFFVAELVAP